MATLRVPVTSHDHILGGPDFRATLVEYGDYECPFCGMAHPVMAQLLEHFGPDLRYVFRHFPLSEAHPNAAAAAETAEFAGDHGRFWEMHDGLYVNQAQLGPALFMALAARLELPQEGLRRALVLGLHAEKIRADFLGGVRSGVNATPSFFVNDQRHDGGFAFTDLAAAIEVAMGVRAGAASSGRPLGGSAASSSERG
jgi:protein-disulfide isomerase